MSGRRFMRLALALACAVISLAAVVVASAADAAGEISLRLPPPIHDYRDPAGSVRILSYHDVQDKLREVGTPRGEPTTLDTDELIAQLSWLRESGYQPIRLDDLLAARRGGPPLPDRAVLLTFDDGYRSFYTRVFPLLKLFNFPAVLAVVGSWIDVEPGGQVEYGTVTIQRDNLVTWAQAKEMVDSGLVEIASHSYNLHRGIPGNPQGNLMPAATTLEYRGGRYETEAAFRERIRADLRRNSDLIQRHTGRRPRAIAWPYGEYNLVVSEVARSVGLEVGFSLEPGPNTPSQPVSQLRRHLVEFHHDLSDFIDLMRQPAENLGRFPPLERVVHADLDYIYDPNPVQQEANLSAFIERMAQLRPSTVYLQAFADPDGDGVADAVYFPSRHLPMRADLFSRVAWQLRTRANVRVYAWMPVLSFRLPAGHAVAGRVVETAAEAPAAARAGRYHRLSPFDPSARQVIREIYADLGRNSSFAGLLFHDDATLNDWEDASPLALDTYSREWGLPRSIAAIRGNPAHRKTWSQRKTEALDRFTAELAQVVRSARPGLITARNLYARVVLEPESEEWFAQSFESALANYDFVAVMAMPYMENASDPDAWLKRLVERVRHRPGAIDRTVFELQAMDWRTRAPVPGTTLASQMRLLQLSGARNFGYYPDDFIQNRPDLTPVRRVLSIESHPARR